MTLDYSRYLTAYSDADSEAGGSGPTQRAYSEWGSFCYLAFSAAAKQRQCQTAERGGQSSLPLHRYIIDKNNNNVNGSVSDENTTMPRPPGQQFGSRLNNATAFNGICHENNANNAQRRRKPALGINGLRSATSQQIGSLSVPISDAGLPRRRTTSVRTSFSSSVSCRQNSATTIVEQHEQISVITDNSNFRSLSCRTSKSSYVQRCSEVIEEGSEVESSSSSGESRPETPVDRPRTISFADERGADLVTCRYFDPESSCESEEEPEVTSASEDETVSSDEDFSQVEGDFVPKRRRFPMLADECYRSVCDDINSVKELLKKNRAFFENLCPQSEADVNGNKSLSGNADDEEACVLFPPCNRTTFAPIQTDTASRDLPQCNIPRGDDVTDAEQISQTEAHLSEQIKEVYDLMVDSHTADCVKSDLSELQTDLNNTSQHRLLKCSLSNFDRACADRKPYETLFVNKSDLRVTGDVIEGSLIGSGVCRGKRVFLRLSTDKWRSFTDFEAQFRERVTLCACADQREEVETYGFAIPLPAVHDRAGRLIPHAEFALFCEDSDAGCRYWNNNENRNFKVDFHHIETEE